MKKALAALAATGLMYWGWRLWRGQGAGQNTGQGAALGDIYDTGQDWQEPLYEPNIFENTMNQVKAVFSGNDIAAVIQAGPGWLIVRRPDGRTEKLTGARNWRNNNPGNIEAGAFANSMGAIGSDGRFAIFPTYAMGRAAKEKLIFEGKNYAGLTLTQAINRYAPPVENNTAGYQGAVLASVGANKPMKTYTASERQAIMDAMEKVEGFKVGSVSAWA